MKRVFKRCEGQNRKRGWHTIKASTATEAHERGGRRGASGLAEMGKPRKIEHSDIPKGKKLKGFGKNGAGKAG